MSSSELEVSVVVLAFRLKDELRHTLDALTKQVSPPPFEVIVISNGAPPAIREVAETHAVVGKLIALENNVGFGRAVNIASASARGKYLVLLNDDAIPAHNWLSEIVQTARLHPEAAVVGSVLLNLDGTVQEAGARILQSAGVMPWGQGLSLKEARSSQILSVREVDYVSAAATLIRLDAYRSVGGFDPIFEPAYFEDVDLILRMRQKGWKAIVSPLAVVKHIRSASTEDMPLFREFCGQTNGARFIERWARMLDKAPLEEASPAELCDPNLVTQIPRFESQFDPIITPEKVEERIRIAYLNWLEKTVGSSRTANQNLENEKRRIELRTVELENRLKDLAERGPLGLVKFFFGQRLSKFKFISKTHEKD